MIVEKVPVNNLMLTTVTEHQAQIAYELCENEKLVTDDTGMSNAAKWNSVMHVFKAHKATLFSIIDYDEIYRDDAARTCEAAAHMCDLRAQFFEILLDEEPTNQEFHSLYLQNRQWQVRMRERVRLQAFIEVAKVSLKPF